VCAHFLLKSGKWTFRELLNFKYIYTLRVAFNVKAHIIAFNVWEQHAGSHFKPAKRSPEKSTARRIVLLCKSGCSNIAEPAAAAKHVPTKTWVLANAGT